MEKQANGKSGGGEGRSTRTHRYDGLVAVSFTHTQHHIHREGGALLISVPTTTHGARWFLLLGKCTVRWDLVG